MTGLEESNLNEIQVMTLMKLLRSLESGVSSHLMLSASSAMRPMTVLSPIVTTMPQAEPSTTLVEKKARFSVSRGFVLVHAGLFLCGLPSPVSEELSTLKFLKNK